MVGSKEVEWFGELGNEQANSAGGQKGVEDVLAQVE